MREQSSEREVSGPASHRQSMAEIELDFSLFTPHLTRTVSPLRSTAGLRAPSTGPSSRRRLTVGVELEKGRGFGWRDLGKRPVTVKYGIECIFVLRNV